MHFHLLVKNRCAHKAKGILQTYNYKIQNHHCFLCYTNLAIIHSLEVCLGKVFWEAIKQVKQCFLNADDILMPKLLPITKCTVLLTCAFPSWNSTAPTYYNLMLCRNTIWFTCTADQNKLESKNLNIKGCVAKRTASSALQTGSPCHQAAHVDFRDTHRLVTCNYIPWLLDLIIIYYELVD